MTVTFPGTTVETSVLEKDCSVRLFDGIFAAGGITLSQVSIMTGLEPYMIQNWVKRGFLSSPQKRLYSREQFARIITINMLREVLPLETVSHLIHIISGNPHDVNDDLIGDEALYHRYVNLLADKAVNLSDPMSVRAAADRAAADFREPNPGAAAQLSHILQAMLYAHTASQMRDSATELLASLQ